MPACQGQDICLKHAPLFTGLPDEDKCEIHSLVRQKTFASGEQIHMEGDLGEGLYIVRRGTVKLYKSSSSGKEQVLAFLRYGDIFGERTLLLDEPLAISAEAVEPTTVCLIKKSDFNALLASKPALALALARSLASRVESMVGVVGRLTLQDARERLAGYLVSLARGAGRQIGQGIEVELPASRAEIGKLLGMTPETLSRRMSELYDEGLVTPKGRRLLVLSQKLIEG